MQNNYQDLENKSYEPGLSAIGLSSICLILVFFLARGFLSLKNIKMEKDIFINYFLLIVFALIIIIPLSLFSMSASLKGKRSEKTLEIIFSKIGFIVSIVDIIGTLLILIIGVMLNK